jgi:hypothetical protein
MRALQQIRLPVGGWAILALIAAAGLALADEAIDPNKPLSPAEAAKWWEDANQKERMRDLTIVFEVSSVTIPTGSQPQGTPWPIVLSSKAATGTPQFRGFLANQLVRDVNRLGIFDAAKYFQGRVVEVKGRMKPVESASDQPPKYEIVVEELSRFRVVK